MEQKLAFMIALKIFHAMVVITLVIICIVQANKLKKYSSVKDKRRGVIRFPICREDWKTGRDYDMTEVVVEVAELERFNNGYSRIKVLNVSGALDPRQFEHAKKSTPNIVETDEVEWFK